MCLRELFQVNMLLLIKEVLVKHTLAVWNIRITEFFENVALVESILLNKVSLHLFRKMSGHPWRKFRTHENKYQISQIFFGDN